MYSSKCRWAVTAALQWEPWNGILTDLGPIWIGGHVAENPVTIYDLHATILRLLGLDHKQLTFYHNGIRRRLTDVHGPVLEALLA